MLMTRDTFHSPINPCRLLSQSSLGDGLTHARTAPLSCSVFCGENTGVEGVEVRRVRLNFGQKPRGCTGQDLHQELTTVD